MVNIVGTISHCTVKLVGDGSKLLLPEKVLEAGASARLMMRDSVDGGHFR